MSDTSHITFVYFNEPEAKNVERNDDGSIKMGQVVIVDHDVHSEHNYSCPICLKSKAVRFLNLGIFLPCHSCTDDGWMTIKPKGWRAVIIRWLVGDR